MIKRIVGLGVLFIMIFSLGGCGNKYEAVLYDDAGEWLNMEFRSANLTYGTVYFEGEELDSEESLSYPESRIHIIKTQEEFEDIFLEFSSEINFEKEMLLIYVFTDTFSNKYKIKNTTFNDGVLKIACGIRFIPTWGNSRAPAQRFFAIKMKTLDITTAEVSTT
jgi:hypothetical protein